MRRNVVGDILGSITAAGLLVTVSAGTVRAQSMDPEVLESITHASVMVITASSKSKEGDTPYGSGSGFFVNATGLAITNNHVVDPGHKKSQAEKFQLKEELNRLVWTVVTDSGTDEEKEWRADVVYQNEQADIAVLQTRDEEGGLLKSPDFLKFVPSSDVNSEMKAWCLGFPGGDNRTGDTGDHPVVAVTSGNILGLRRASSGRLKMIDTDVLANPGNSGGPFVNIAGRLVGVLTLGGQDEARTNTTRLVPGDLVQEMIRTAFYRGKMFGGIDKKPFYDLFMTRERIWDFPMHRRLDGIDCLTLEGGTRLCGSVTGATVTWPTPLGDIEVPVPSMAYVLRDDDEMSGFLDGGDRFPIEAGRGTIKFALPGGTTRQYDLDDISSIVFRKAQGNPSPPSKPAYVIGGERFRVSLLDVAGDVRFDVPGLGEISIPAGDVRGIEGDDERVLSTSSGSRMSGEFLPHSLTGRLAWCGTAIRFSFEGEEIADCVVSLVDYKELSRVGEIDLANTIKTADRRLTLIAESLDRGEIDSAGAKLTPLLEPKLFRALSAEKQEQVQFLNGEYRLRSSKYQEAYGIFKRLAKKNARVPEVRWSAAARLSLLDRHSDGSFDGQPLSEPDVFEQAGRALAEDYRIDARRLVKSVEGVEPDKRSDYTRLLKRSDDAEEKLLISSRLTAGESEEYLVRLWRAVATLHRSEINRLTRERQERQDTVRERAGERGLTEYQRRQLDRKVDRIDRDIESAREALAEVLTKIRDAGFIIDDPDRD